MDKVLCNKDEEFISIQNENYNLMELKDGDYLTHKDGAIVIYKEVARSNDDERVYIHAYLKYGMITVIKRYGDFYDYANSGFRFSTKEEKEFMDKMLFMDGLKYNPIEKCIEKCR